MDPSHFDKLNDLKAKLPENVRRQFEKKFPQLMANMDPAYSNWNSVKEEGDFKLFNRKDEGFVTQRAHMESNHNIESLIPLFKNIENRLKYDQVIEESEVIQKQSENFQILRSQIKGKFMVISPRDFVTYNVSGWLDKDTFLDMHFTPDDFEHPKTKAVRAYCDTIATIFKRAGDHKTIIDSYSRVDPDLKMVPQSFVEKGSKDSGYLIKYFSDFADKTIHKPHHAHHPHEAHHK